MRNLLFMVGCILLFSCSDKIEHNQEDGIKNIIEYGVFGGLCGHLEFITLENKEVSYELKVICDTTANTSTSRALTSVEVNMFNELFDESVFNSLDWTSCNRCVDGMDYFVQSTNGDAVKRLEFSSPDEELEELKEVIDFLDGLFVSFR